MEPEPSASGSSRVVIAGVALFAVMALVIALLAFLLGSARSSADATPAPTPTPTPTATPPTVSEIFQQVGPSVVVVKAGKGLGTGVIVAEDATILTANHVIAEAPEKVTVTFSDGTESSATVVSADPSQDIATLLPDSLPEITVPAVLGGGAEVGAPVVAIGNPLGLAYSVSSGIVAGVDRTADTDAGDFAGLIQFDAAVNPGSSGGPLLDATGSVIGIVVSIADPGHDDSWSGIGFAVPIGAALGGSGPAAGRAKDLRCDTSQPGRNTMTSDYGTGLSPTHPLEQVLFEVKRVIVGQDLLLERMAVALLTGGHLLVEGVPGLAKTLAVKSLASAIGGQFQRIQFTPDLVPADLIGTRVYRQQTSEFQTELGPVFTNLLLADEINRAPAKVQSALLEVMQEHQVTIGRETFPVPEPFLVMATENPIESEGTYPLPEAQVDRFMMKVLVGYPSAAEEQAIVDRSLRPSERITAMLSPEHLIRMRADVQRVYVDPAIVDYSVRLVSVTRTPAMAGLGDLERYVTYGASPRASIALVAGARALAFLRGREYVLPHDLSDLAFDVLRHRVVLSYEALADDIDPDAIIARVLGAVRAPDVVLQSR